MDNNLSLSFSSGLFTTNAIGVIAVVIDQMPNISVIAEIETSSKQRL